jgi:curved DNA-binding protein CbpA
MPEDDPLQILGLPAETGEEEIRAAYLRKVREFPPDRFPREFEKVRDAYEALRDPHRRARQILLADPQQSLESLLPAETGERKFVGLEPWMDVLQGTRP